MNLADSFGELSNEQRRQMIDVRQAYEEWRRTRHDLKHSYTGSMRWASRKGREYLLRKNGRSEKSLGPRSDRTEAEYQAFVSGRERLKDRAASLARRLDELAPVNRALNLGRVPRLTARIIRRLDEAGLLGTHLFVLGTNAIYAYEAAAGVHIGAEFLATGDADLLWDARRRLRLAFTEAHEKGVIGILQKVDHSFRMRGKNDIRAINDEGFSVDLVRAQDAQAVRPGAKEVIGERRDDLHAAALFGLKWLINAPKFSQMAMGEDGYPLMMACVDPRVFALHKLWISGRFDREPIKRRRDSDQARLVAALATKYLALDFAGGDLSALPQKLRDLATALSPDEGEDRDEDRGESGDIPEPDW